MSLADTITETDLKPKNKGGRPPAVKPEGVKRVLPLNFTTPHTLAKTEEGYQYDNVLIGNEVPSYAIALMAESRIPEEAIQDFSIVKGILASPNPKQAKGTKNFNGIIHWPEGKYTIPSIGTEVYLRILEDRIKNDPQLKVQLAEKVRVHVYKRLHNVINALRD